MGGGGVLRGQLPAPQVVVFHLRGQVTTKPRSVSFHCHLCSIVSFSLTSPPAHPFLLFPSPSFFFFHSLSSIKFFFSSFPQFLVSIVPLPCSSSVFPSLISPTFPSVSLTLGSLVSLYRPSLLRYHTPASYPSPDSHSFPLFNLPSLFPYFFTSSSLPLPSLPACFTLPSPSSPSP